MKTRLLLLGLFVPLLAGLLYAGARYSDTGPVPQDSTTYTREALFERLYRIDRRLLVVHAASDPAQVAAVQAQFSRGWWTRNLDLSIRSVTEVEAADLHETSVLLIGTPSKHRLLAQLAEQLPLSFSDEGFVFQGKTYDGPNDALTLLYPNPLAPSFPLFIRTGNSEAVVYEPLQQRLSLNRSLGDYEISRDGRRLRWGHFAQDAHRSWAYAPEQDRDIEKEIRLAQSTAHYQFFVQNEALTTDALASFATEREQVYERLEAFLGKQAAFAGPMAYYVYPGIEEKALVTNDMHLSHADMDAAAVHVAFDEGVDGAGHLRDVQVVLRRSLGEPRHHLLETGLAVSFSETWGNAGYAYWAGRLYGASGIPPLASLLDNNELAQASPLVTEPLAASLVALLLETWGRDAFLERYATWAPTPQEVADLERLWHADLARRWKAAAAQALPPVSLPPDRQNGFNFAHEGYGIINGYGSKAADASLERLVAIGANAVAVIPYSFVREPDRPSMLPIPRSVGSENDGAVLHAALAARRLGLSVMLKPQIWAGRQWSGDIEMTSAADWDRFFEHYERWIRHYAMMAELHGIEILCIGTEMGKTTLGHEARWRAMAQRLRTLYSGKLVYAANWWGEFEDLTFWDAFDYIGLNSYYPLSDKDDATDEELRQGAEAMVRKAEEVQQRYRKPVLITEIGFTSTHAPWKHPHEDSRNDALNLDHQARSYEAVFQALQGKPWIEGIYLWKWPSYLERGGPNQKGFTPNRKSAEGTATRWFSVLGLFVSSGLSNREPDTENGKTEIIAR